jgi:hypothetical protein
MAKFATICLLLAVAAIAARKYIPAQRLNLWDGSAQQQPA